MSHLPKTYIDNKAPFSVKDFGAKGDGVTDDTVSIFATIAAVAASGGGTVFFPSGTYIVSNQILIAYNNITLCGVRGASIIKAKNNVDFIVVLRADNKTGVIFRDLNVDVNQAGRIGVISSQFVGIGFNNGTDCGVYNCTVSNAASGPGFAMGGTCVRCIFSECTAINCGILNHASDGFFIGGTQCLGIGCIAINCNDTAFVIESSNYSGYSGCTSLSSACGAAITNASGAVASGNFLNGITIHDWSASLTGGVQIGLPANTTGNLLDTNISGLTIHNISGTGPAINVRNIGSGLIKGLVINNAIVNGAGTQALLIAAGTQDVVIDGGIYTSNEYAILLGANCNKISILNTQLNPHGGSSGGIGINAGCTLIEIHNNLIDCASSAAYGMNIGASCTVRESNNKILNNISTAILEGSVVDHIYIDLVNTQTIAGAKTFSNAAVFSSTLQTVSSVGVGVTPTRLLDVNGDSRLRGKIGINQDIDSNAEVSITSGGTDKAAVQAISGGGNTGYVLGANGANGGIDNNINTTAGDVRVAGSLRVGIGVSSGSYPWTYSGGINVRSNGSVVATGIGIDPSTIAGYLQVTTVSLSNDQLYLKPGGIGFPTTKLDGGLSYDGNRLAFCLGTTTRYNVALKVVDVAYNFNPGAIGASATTDLSITVAGALVGDKVLIDFASTGLDAGLIFGGAWVSTNGTVIARIFNSTASAITPASVNWNVSVIHT